MKASIKNILILAIVCFFLCSPNVFATTLAGETVEINGVKVVKWYTNSTKLKATWSNDPYASGNGSYYELMTVDGEIAYCIEIGVQFIGGTTTTISKDLYTYFYDGFIHMLVSQKYNYDISGLRAAIMNYLYNNNQTLYDEYTSTENRACGGAGLCPYEWYVDNVIRNNAPKLADSNMKTQAKDLANELVRQISLYIKYGNELIENSTSAVKKTEYHLATQQLIWLAISDTGFYESLWYLSRCGAGFIIEHDFHWAYEGEGRNDYTTLDVSDEIAAIEKAIDGHDTTPSMCSSKYQLNLLKGESVTYTDTNNVLKEFNVTCTGNLSCTTSGNQLTITALYNGGTQKVTFTKKGSTDTLRVYQTQHSTNYLQGVVYGQGTTDDVSCELGQQTVSLNDLTCNFRYHHQSTRTAAIDIYDMENNLIATESINFGSNTTILAGTYTGLRITDTQKAEVWVNDSEIILKDKFGNVVSNTTRKKEFESCRRLAIETALYNSSVLSTGILNWGGAYTVSLTNSNNISGSNMTISQSEASGKRCYTINSTTGQEVLDSDCKFSNTTTAINQIIANAKNGVNEAVMYIEYQYKKAKTCMNVKTGTVRYISVNASSQSCYSYELAVENDVVNGEEHWHYFVPLNSKSNSNVSVKITKTKNVAAETSSGNVTRRFPIEQKFYNEMTYSYTKKFQGFNFYYKQIDIENPFPNINMTDVCKNGMPYESLWGNWLLAKCSNKTETPDLSKSFDKVTYIAANINTKTVRQYNKLYPYTVWSYMSPNGTSSFISNYGIIRRNGTQKVYKLGCGPANNTRYITNTKIEDPLYIKGCS